MRALAIAGLAWIAVVATAARAAPAAAGPKILVLPVEGAVDAATRSRLTADIARLARSLDGQVSTGSATFADTALAVGCDPRAAGCSDDVMATLGVDELVWGVVRTDRGQIRLTVRRAARGAAIREVSTTFASGDAGDRVTTGIAPLFAPPGAEPTPPARSPALPAPAAAAATAPQPADATGAPLAAAPPPPAPADTERSHRTLGIALAAAGGGSIAVGVALWVSYASAQDSIDHHPTGSLSELQDLRALEDRASTYAIAGDLLVIAGLVAGGIGGYLLYRDHAQHAVAIAPAPVAGGGLMLTLTGGL